MANMTKRHAFDHNCKLDKKQRNENNNNNN